MQKILDRIDCGILAALQHDGRLSNKELAAKVGLAPSSCLERVRRLWEEGILRGVHADVNPRALGVGLEAIVHLRLRNHSRGSLSSMRAHLLAQKEVVAAYYLGGADDFLVHVAVRDTEHLRDLGLDVLSAHPDMEHMETNLIFDYTRRPVLPNYVPDVEPQ